ncbi:MAG: hypothetical protein KDC48_13735, partial [Planctomycetes bacterium]|nr:hypothetical protein [Planctomycetota bacterium]
MSKTDRYRRISRRPLSAWSLPALLPLALGLAGCLSASPPAPPVRWFDPMPAQVAAPSVAASFRCRAAATVAREFVFRVGPR